MRVPVDDSSQKKYHAFLNGEIETSDLGYFPSDRAGFLLLSPWDCSLPIGASALSHRVDVLSNTRGKVIAGHHTPVDIGAGAAIGALALTVPIRNGPVGPAAFSTGWRWRAMNRTKLYLMERSKRRKDVPQAPHS